MRVRSIDSAMADWDMGPSNHIASNMMGCCGTADSGERRLLRNVQVGTAILLGGHALEKCTLLLMSPGLLESLIAGFQGAQPDVYTVLMSRRSLPERTVDAWVSSATCAAFPHARIWAPTQNIEEANWDYGLSLGNGKLFIFEDKGTTTVQRTLKMPLDTHRIYFDIEQLTWYCDRVECVTGVPTYYILPQPPWLGDSGSEVVPNQAICRVDSVAGPFTEWAYIIRSNDLRAELGDRCSIDTDQLPIKGAQTLADFFRGVQGCEIGKRISGPGDASSMIAKAPEQASRDREATDHLIGDINQRQYIGSALAVFVPAQDLPGWGE